MLTADEQDELDLLSARVYGPEAAGDAVALADLDRLRELENRARGVDLSNPANEEAPSHSTRWRRRRLGWGFTVGVAVASVLVGLVGGALNGTAAPATRTEGIPELNYIASQEDALPGDFDVPIEASTVRYVATLDDGTVFVGRNAGPDHELCIVVIFGGSSDGFYGSVDCGADAVTTQVSADTWVVIGEPQTEKMNNITLARFQKQQLSESVMAYSLVD